MIETLGSDPLDDRSHLAIETHKYDRTSAAVALGSTLVQPYCTLFEALEGPIRPYCTLFEALEVP